MENKPKNLAITKFFSFLPHLKNSITANVKPGQKAILKCSQVLSLTAAIIAIGRHYFVHSNQKWRVIPNTMLKAIPISSHRTIFLSITTPFSILSISDSLKN